MSRHPRINIVALLLLIAAFAGSVIALKRVEGIRGKQATLEEVLYVPSGKTLKQLSLGYSGLLADIYWTRAVQYYGQRLMGAKEEVPRYDLLYPLLDITTDLDPHLIVAYEFGSVFLSQQPPVGAGQPDKAVTLLEKGIRANPDYWRLYFTLGFVQYIDRHDYKAAQQAFEKGSENPKALYWMKVMAARMAERANDPNTAIYLWTHIYESVEDKMVRDNALQHIAAAHVDVDVPELERRIMMFQQKSGHLPATWQELVRDGLLGGVPLDPTNRPYKLMEDGRVQVEDPDSLPFITHGLPPGWKKSTKPH
ncbi:MAG TPA: tetratricopeptide repeat protein [Candidatus Angelobacter sp.]|nr:tetratricopeptide repeat protein [Candidatus Angelobacter sp.]